MVVVVVISLQHFSIFDSFDNDNTYDDNIYYCYKLFVTNIESRDVGDSVDKLLAEKVLDLNYIRVSGVAVQTKYCTNHFDLTSDG